MMRGTRTRCAAFAVCGSFCTLDAALDAARPKRVSCPAAKLITGRSSRV